MIICNHCRHVFEESEWGDYGECPSCNSTDTGEAEQCPICGEYHNGFFEGHAVWCCSECFQKALTPENFLKYATNGYAKYHNGSDDPDVLEDFIMYELFNIDEPLKRSSAEFKEHCVDLYNELCKPVLGVRKIDELIKNYLADVPDVYTCFSEWLVEEHKHNDDMKRYFDEVTP